MPRFELLIGGGERLMPKKVDWYRQNAEKCQQLAQSFKNPDAKRTLAMMAELVADAGRATRQKSR